MMDDSKQKSGVWRIPWQLRVDEILAKTQARARRLMWLGFIVYGLGSAAILWFMRNAPALATASIMFFFQLLVIYMATREIFPCISGSFKLAIEANRDAVPAFEELGDLVREVRQAAKTGEHPVLERLETHLKKMADDIAAMRKRVERDTAPLTVVRRGKANGGDVDAKTGP